MLKIFAKYKTDEKVAVYCHQGQISTIQNELNSQFGGNWLLVDECMTGGEILKFNDGQIYNGFKPNKPENYRYSKAIVRFRINGR